MRVFMGKNGSIIQISPLTIALKIYNRLVPLI